MFGALLLLVSCLSMAPATPGPGGVQSSSMDRSRTAPLSADIASFA